MMGLNEKLDCREMCAYLFHVIVVKPFTLHTRTLTHTEMQKESERQGSALFKPATQ